VSVGRFTDEDGIDGPFNRAIKAAMRDDDAKALARYLALSQRQQRHLETNRERIATLEADLAAAREAQQSVERERDAALRALKRIAGRAVEAGEWCQGMTTGNPSHYRSAIREALSDISKWAKTATAKEST
jgi:chromosome segregation ATPase